MTWIAWMVGGSFLLIPVLLLMVRDPDAAQEYLKDPTNFKLLQMDMILIFVLIMWAMLSMVCRV